LFCKAKLQKPCHSSRANAKGLLQFKENFSGVLSVKIAIIINHANYYEISITTKLLTSF
jgi:hypothetical protein